MKKIGILVLLITCFKISMGELWLPGTAHAENFRLYETLNLSETISFPAFRQALAGYTKYITNENNSLLVLIDFTKPSTEKRFCVIDLKQEKVLFMAVPAVKITQFLFPTNPAPIKVPWDFSLPETPISVKTAIPFCWMD